ncbi:hypothetical protein BDM02DRAFT_3119120, partial [Thelephora ganbajun]
MAATVQFSASLIERGTRPSLRSWRAASFWSTVRRHVLPLLRGQPTRGSRSNG